MTGSTATAVTGVFTTPSTSIKEITKETKSDEVISLFDAVIHLLAKNGDDQSKRHLQILNQKKSDFIRSGGK